MTEAARQAGMLQASSCQLKNKEQSVKEKWLDGLSGVRDTSLILIPRAQQNLPTANCRMHVAHRSLLRVWKLTIPCIYGASGIPIWHFQYE
jgi:hypothetical protein